MIDSKVISAVMQGDPQAFEKVYLQTHDKAYSIAYRVLKDDYEAEDIVQDAYIKMIEQVSQLQNPEKLESWFYRIVQNKALDYLRTSHSDTFSNFESEDTDFSFSDTLVSDYTPFDPEASADYAELKRIMDGFVKELPEMQRKCIILRFQGDKKISEIAQILGIPESTVKSNLNYGKKKIEGEVRALEKQGVKLYSLSPLTVIAFLRWMWGKSAVSAISAGVGSAGAATGAAAAVSATAGGTSSASAAAGSAAAGTAAKTGAAIGAKQIIAGVCAAAVIGASAVGIALHNAEDKLEDLFRTETHGTYAEPFELAYCVPQFKNNTGDFAELNTLILDGYDLWEDVRDYYITSEEEHNLVESRKAMKQHCDIPDYSVYPQRTGPFVTVQIWSELFFWVRDNPSAPAELRQRCEQFIYQTHYWNDTWIHQDTGKAATWQDLAEASGIPLPQLKEQIRSAVREYAANNADTFGVVFTDKMQNNLDDFLADDSVLWDTAHFFLYGDGSFCITPKLYDFEFTTGAVYAEDNYDCIYTTDFFFASTRMYFMENLFSEQDGFDFLTEHQHKKFN